MKQFGLPCKQLMSSCNKVVIPVMCGLYVTILTLSLQPLKIVKRPWSHCYQELTVYTCTCIPVRYTCGSPSGNVGLDSGAFLLRTELFECANQIVACLITGVAHWHPDACADANW